MRTAAALFFALLALTIVPAAQSARAKAAPSPELEQALARWKAGRVYNGGKTGRIAITTTARNQSLDNVLEVPADYDPTRRWPLRVSLHGGVGRKPPRQGDGEPRPLSNRMPLEGELVLHPRAWETTEWWTNAGVDNIARLVERVKRDYNVDEARIYVTGISDGGTGVYFLAMRDATLWAACVPLNGHPLVLANPSVGAEGLLFPANASNCPMHAVNGGRDRLYPAASVEPFVDLFRRAGATLEWQVYPEAGHDVSWWPQERARFQAFLARHPRVAHPASVSWETDGAPRGSTRFRWLVLTRLGARPSDVRLDDVNAVNMGREGTIALYDRGRASGRVDAVRRGNAFELKTRGLAEITLLLSRDVIDFSKPVHVTVNGRVVHDVLVPENVATLNEWAERDQDRTMLYTASLRVRVP
jgi:poly(3-hydroxybutyrate) depolymerase